MISSGLAILGTCFTVIYPLALIMLVNKHDEDELESISFKNRFGGLFAIFDKKSKMCACFPSILLLRKIVFSAVLIYFQEDSYL